MDGDPGAEREGLVAAASTENTKALCESFLALLDAGVFENVPVHLAWLKNNSTGLFAQLTAVSVIDQTDIDWIEALGDGTFSRIREKGEAGEWEDIRDQVTVSDCADARALL